MTRAPRLALVLAAAALAACAPPPPQPGVTSRISAPYVEAQHQYHFLPHSAVLSGPERDRMTAFLRPLALQPGDFMIVTIPSGGSAATDRARVQTLQAALALVPAKIQMNIDTTFQTTPTRVQAGLLRVTRARGLAVNCTPGIEAPGCANAVNLAAMIHEPGDMLAPAQTGRRNVP